MNIRDAIAAGLIVLTGASLAHAEPVAKCNGTTYQWCKSIGDTNVFLNDPNDLTTVKDGYIYMADGCGAVPSNPKCNDSDEDGQVDEVISKTAQEIADEQAAQEEANTLSTRTSAETTVDAFNVDGVVFRAAMLAILDQINALRSDIQAISEASGQIPDVSRPAFSPAQMKTAIKNKINAGDAD